jgi:hypothetical protein
MLPRTVHLTTLIGHRSVTIQAEVITIISNPGSPGIKMPPKIHAWSEDKLAAFAAEAKAKAMKAMKAMKTEPMKKAAKKTKKAMKDMKAQKADAVVEEGQAKPVYWRLLRTLANEAAEGRSKRLM